MTLPRHLALAAAVVLIGFAAASSDESAADAGATYTERHLASARTHRDAGRSEEARAEFLKVLERDGGNFHALEGLVSLAVEAGEEDETVYYMYRFVDRASKLRDLDAPHRKRLKEYKLLLKEKDPNHGKLGSYRAAHLRRLLNLGAAHMKKGRYHSAKAIFEEVLHIAPSNAEARAALRRIRTDAGNEFLSRECRWARELLDLGLPVCDEVGARMSRGLRAAVLRARELLQRIEDPKRDLFRRPTRLPNRVRLRCAVRAWWPVPARNNPTANGNDTSSASKEYASNECQPSS